MFLLISWRWVVNVVAVIISTRHSATIITVALASGLSPQTRAPQNDSESGTFPKILASPNCFARSAVRNPCALSCLAAWSSSRNSAKKIGICRRIGRQDANGLVPASL